MAGYVPPVFGPGGDPTQGMSGSQTATAGTGSMMPGLALGGYLLGTGMDIAGQYQGAKAMEAAARRQLAEQEAFNQQRQALIAQELARREANPIGASHSAAAGARFGVANRAVQTSAGAAGKALGVNAAGINAAQTSLLPTMRVDAQHGAGQDRQLRDRNALTMLGIRSRDIGSRSQEAASAYGTEDDLAGMAGQDLRLGGGLLRMGGSAGLSYAMQRPR